MKYITKLKKCLVIVAFVISNLSMAYSATVSGDSVKFMCYDDHNNPYGPYTVRGPDASEAGQQIADYVCLQMGYTGGGKVIN